MIWAWVGIIIGFIGFVGGIYTTATINRRSRYQRTDYKILGAVSIISGIIVMAGSSFWLYGTEAGARAQKTWQSTTGGGLTRVVTVYDMEGDKVAVYEGKFDVDANADRIIFDVPQEDGTYLRHQIWPSTGTVTIEEK